MKPSNQARKVVRCVNAQDKCLSYEVIRKEVNPIFQDQDTNDKPRIIINPEYVQQMDQSDGANQWSD